MSSDINVKIGAQIAGLLGGLEEAKGAVATSVGEMKASMASLGEVAASVQAPFLALAGILAGGALFKGVIGGTVEWTENIIRLSQRLGITTEDASGLAAALDHLGISTDEYGGIVNKVTRQMRTNEQAFTALGIHTKDQNGQWRNSQGVMADVIAKLNEMKAGTDRNVAAQALMGGRVGDLTNLLRLNAGVLREGAEEAEKLNLKIGPDGESKVIAYKQAMADLGLVVTSLKVQVGNALIPALTQLGTQFRDSGPSAANFFAESIKFVTEAALEAWAAINALVQTVKFGYTLLTTPINTQWLSTVKTAWHEMGDEVTKVNDKVLDALQALKGIKNGGIAPPTPPPPVPPEQTTLNGGNLAKDNGDTARQREWALAEAGYKLREAQAQNNEQEIINIKAAAVGKALQIFGAGTTQYLAAETDLQNALNKADDDATKKRLDLQKQASDETRRVWETVLTGLANSIQQSLAGMLQGTVTMAQAIKSLMKTVISEFVSMNVKTLIAHIANEKAKTAATAQGTAERSGLEEWAAMKSVAIHAWQTITEIGHDAVAGAAAAFKSIAAIPIIGPALAPAAAAAAGVAIIGFAGQVASAEGGYDIPRGLNPMTQLHQSEMVLPAELANKVRNMTDAGSGGDVHFHVHAIDHHGVEKFFKKHGGKIVDAVKSGDRNFKFDG